MPKSEREEEARREIRRLANHLPEHARYGVITALQDPAAPTCTAVCRDCGKRCSGKHYNQIHGVDPDDHWGGPKF